MPPPQLLDHDRPLLGVGRSGFVAERNRPAAQLVEAFERLDQVAEERIAALLAVGDDVEAGGLLERDGLVDGAVLDRLECGGRDRTGLQLRARARPDTVDGAGCQSFQRDSRTLESRAYPRA